MSGQLWRMSCFPSCLMFYCITTKIISHVNLSPWDSKGSYSKHHSVGMGGGSLGFAGSIASFCMALLNAYCEEKSENTDMFHLLKVCSCGPCRPWWGSPTSAWTFQNSASLVLFTSQLMTKTSGRQRMLRVCTYRVTKRKKKNHGGHDKEQVETLFMSCW